MVLSSISRLAVAKQMQVSDLSATQGQLREHVERMFAAPAWRALPRLAQLADALKALQGQAAEAARGAQTYGRGTQLLRESDQLLQAALQGLQQTQMFTMVRWSMRWQARPGRGIILPPSKLHTSCRWRWAWTWATALGVPCPAICLKTFSRCRSFSAGGWVGNTEGRAFGGGWWRFQRCRRVPPTGTGPAAYPTLRTQH